MVTKRANSSIVIPEWINTIDELRSDICATQLPSDNSTWGASGFVVVSFRGPADFDLPVGRPLVEIEVYAGLKGASRPLWGTANNIYQAIVAAHRDTDAIQRELTLSVRGKSYGKARVMSCYPVEEERKSPTLMNGDYACIYAAWRFHWTTAN